MTDKVINSSLDESEEWDLIIESNKSWFDLRLIELWKYRDLILLFVKRDFVTQYKQTLLGPLWHIIQPLATTFFFTIIFGRIAHLGTDGSPSVLFYLSGIIVWQFFSGCIIGTSSTFVTNASIFGKIYFPRLVIPISVIISTGIRFLIQLAMFLVVLVFFLFFKKDPGGIVHPNSNIILLPWLFLIVSLMGLGGGILVSALTTKYRDLGMFLGFGMQFLMYLSPVIYSASIWKKYQWVMDINPMTYILEGFRNAFLGTGHISLMGLLYSSLFALAFFLVGATFFSRVEKSFMDTV